MNPELTESEFDSKITEIAKKLIKKYCITETGEITYEDYAAYEYQRVTDEDLIESYPLAIEVYTTGSFGPDARDLLSYEMSECITHIRQNLLQQAIDQKIKNLLNGEWDKITTETSTKEISQTKKVFSEE